MSGRSEPLAPAVAWSAPGTIRRHARARRHRMVVAQAALETRHGPIVTPAFMPDATRGSVRGIDADDLRGVGVRALMTSSFHLMRRPGAQRVARLGGLHRFTGWDGPIVTDSG